MPEILGVFRLRLTLQTLTRGDGVLGLRPVGLFGPRGGNVTVVRVDWTYQVGHAGQTLRWETASPASLMDQSAAATQILYDAQGRQVVMRRNLHADALEAIQAAGCAAMARRPFGDLARSITCAAVVAVAGKQLQRFLGRSDTAAATTLEHRSAARLRSRKHTGLGLA